MKKINFSSIALTLLTWFCLGSTLLAEEAAGEKKQTVWEMFHGGGLVMYLLLVASILIMAFTIVGDRRVQGCPYRYRSMR
jgi:hypothetical protein